jgi:hypothetical protein
MTFSSDETSMLAQLPSTLKLGGSGSSPWGVALIDVIAR